MVMVRRALLLLLLSALGGAVSNRLSPVTRVVELLTGLSEKIEAESKAEEQLYEKFVCWANNVVSTKKASNAESQSRIDMLTTYIADIDAGRIEFTSERTDLEKDLEQINGDLEAATEMRNKENSDFLDAKDEMDKAIGALEEAIAVLKAATVGHEEGTLLAMKSNSRASGGFAARAVEAKKLNHAADLGDKFLTRGDALFLRRLLTGGAEVPISDWKKLNRKADFKKSYKARSFKIQDVLAKLLMTFNANLAEATSKEKEAEGLYETLKEAKLDQKSAAEDALQKLAKESGVKGMSRAEANEENELLKQQVTDDTKYIGEVEGALEKKKSEWKERSVLRTGEIAAITKAISILGSDDSKDLFKKSLASQGYSLLQQGSRRSAAVSQHRRAAAAKLLAGASAGDHRVVLLAKRIASKGHFDQVIAAIDQMVEMLKAEETSDLETKEKCEADRMADTRTAAVTSRTMDELTDTISRLTTEIAEIEAEIDTKEKETAAAKAELADATRVREDEAALYATSKKDDTDAVSLVAKAYDVLSGFYSENGLMLAQQPVVGPIVAGEAPPPPPTTWEAPYGGKTGEATGILSVLQMVKEDIEKDIAKATADEGAAIEEYGELKSDLEKEMEDLALEIGTLKSTKADKQGEIQESESDRDMQNGELEVVMKKIKDAEPSCFYFTINYGVRSKNRQIEIDGLLKAKTILSGGEFATPEDPTREIKPGDALLQRVKAHLL